MRKVFQDPLLQAHFDKNGYVKIQLLDSAQIGVLTKLYLDLTLDKTPTGFFSTAAENITMKQLMHQCFMEHFKHIWTDVLYDYKPVFSNFITKKTAESAISYHQDWAFVDESTGKCSLNVWCPLVNTFHDNGNLSVVPGSQHLKNQLRTSNVNYAPYSQHPDFLKTMAIELPTNLGEAIIMDNALIHGSTSNLCGDNRLTASVLCIPNEEQIAVHLLTADKKTINLYKVNDDYLLNHNPFVDVPDENMLYKQIAFATIEDPLEELRQLKNGQAGKPLGSDNKAGFLKKLMQLFK